MVFAPFSKTRTHSCPPVFISFTFAPNLPLRCVTRGGEPWFVAKDVCDALGINSNATRRLDDEDKSTFNVGLPGKAPTVVNESGLYALILESRKPEAKAFKKWVTSEVLPSIRKTGGYMTQAVAETAITNPAEVMARALVIANETIKGAGRAPRGRKSTALTA
jgi:prophage antirepressor-like protein